MEKTWPCGNSALNLIFCSESDLLTTYLAHYFSARLVMAKKAGAAEEKRKARGLRLRAFQ